MQHIAFGNNVPYVVIFHLASPRPNQLVCEWFGPHCQLCLRADRPHRRHDIHQFLDQNLEFERPPIEHCISRRRSGYQFILNTDLSRLGQDRYSNSRSMNPTLGFRRWHTLYTKAMLLTHPVPYADKKTTHRWTPDSYLSSLKTFFPEIFTVISWIMRKSWELW